MMACKLTGQSLEQCTHLTSSVIALRVPGSHKLFDCTAARATSHTVALKVKTELEICNVIGNR
eukprot:1160396-Pelagomonas_calceolata.AAC.8